MWSRIGLVCLSLAGCVLAAGLIGGILAAPTATTAAMPATEPIAAVRPSAPVATKPTNPVVAPGKVHWHATTADAFAAAKESKKPVLVFHMMGQLDHQFC